MEKKRLSKKKLALIIVACVIISIPTIILPVSTVVVYESIFSMRFHTEEYLLFSPSEFEGLVAERSEFESNSTLTGYKYSKEGMTPKGVIVIAHGLGDGGHNKYMPYIDKFTDYGYYVFGYDAQGTDESDKKAPEGFPQSIKDLDSAIDHVQSINEYKSLPIMLFGHSFGAYSVGNVLNHHPEVECAVMVAGFNESESMLGQYPRKVLGFLVDGVLLPYVSLYERIKFGKEYSKITAVDGMEMTDAEILIVHSQNDKRVPIEYGYEIYYEEFKDDERFHFIKYEDQGHSDMLYSQNAISYRAQLENSYQAYLSEAGKRDKDKVREEYMSKNINKKLYFEPNEELFEKIINLYNSSVLEQANQHFQGN